MLPGRKVRQIVGVKREGRRRKHSTRGEKKRGGVEG